MGARTGAELLAGLQRTTRELYMNGERVDDVTGHPRLAGGARSIAAVCDRQHEYAKDCLVPDDRSRALELVDIVLAAGR